ncbi:hypothetical protein BofuT4_uP042660.1 [Botrytis cinerea T4]|uniref:Uncharacterized protein n=1 Tax=Botryotinia fuckeliana (strain T4) TaxID=999810 RepID=G2Y1W5_BOTF4|nr:hypothetical protein BofuT4_uP042660.1 [Botrytis cinerea T4]
MHPLYKRMKSHHIINNIRTRYNNPVSTPDIGKK